MMMGCKNPLEPKKEINQLKLLPQRVPSLSNHTREQRLTHRSLQTPGTAAWHGPLSNNLPNAVIKAKSTTELTGLKSTSILHVS